jgi:hypothetical protein
MKTAPVNKISKLLLLLFLTLLQFSCSKKNEDFIEFTYGLSMNPEFPRAGIKIKGDNYVYYCEEIMNLGDEFYLNNQTGKYKYFKSEEKVEFPKYKELVIKNFSDKIQKNYISIADATYEQIDFNLDSKKVKQAFFNIQLNSNQEKINNQIWELKKKLKFKSIDSIYFNQERLQEKLPEPPPLNK